MQLDEIGRVLKEKTVWDLRCNGMTQRGYIILNRWATNSPDLLQKLEKRGFKELLVVLRKQVKIEAGILSNPSNVHMRDQLMMPEYEILQKSEIKTELEDIWKP